MIPFIIVGAILLYLFVGVGLVKLIDLNSNWARMSDQWGQQNEGEIDYAITAMTAVFWPFALLVVSMMFLGHGVSLIGKVWVVFMDKVLGGKR